MKRQKAGSHFGPYLPLIIQACQESELAYECRHGVTSFGASTFSLSTILRQQKRVTFNRLVNLTQTILRSLKYEQNPPVLGQGPSWVRMRLGCEQIQERAQHQLIQTTREISLR